MFESMQGTSLIAGPSREIEALNILLNAEMNEDTGEYFVDCNDRYMAKLPLVTLMMGGESVTLTPDDYIVKVNVSQFMLNN